MESCATAARRAEGAHYVCDDCGQDLLLCVAGNHLCHAHAVAEQTAAGVVCAHCFKHCNGAAV